MTRRPIYYGGAPRHPGTPLPSNVTGECPHEHRTPEAAQRCIDDVDRSIKRGNGPGAYCDRVVMVWHAYTSGTRHAWGEECEECEECER